MFTGYEGNKSKLSQSRGTANQWLNVGLCFLIVLLPAIIPFHMALQCILIHRLLFIDVPATSIVIFLPCPEILQLMATAIQSHSVMVHNILLIVLLLCPVIVQVTAIGNVQCLSLAALHLILLLLMMIAYMWIFPELLITVPALLRYHYA